MSSVVLDTHAIVWYLLKSSYLSPAALTAIEHAELVYIASISVVEIIYLKEKGRLPDEALQRLIQALEDMKTGWLVTPLDMGVAKAIRQIPRDVVPDMPDRIITATACYLNLPLVTRDSKIKSAKVQIIW